MVEEIYSFNSTSLTLHERFSIIQAAEEPEIIITRTRGNSCSHSNEISHYQRNKELIEHLARTTEIQKSLNERRQAIKQRIGFYRNRPVVQNNINKRLGFFNRNLYQGGIKSRLARANINLNRSRLRRGSGGGRGRFIRRRGLLNRSNMNTSGNYMPSNGNRSINRGRGRGRVRGRGGGRGVMRRTNKSPLPSKEQLDNELDQYMSCTKSHLDKEIENYMKEANNMDVDISLI